MSPEPRCDPPETRPLAIHECESKALASQGRFNGPEVLWLRGLRRGRLRRFRFFLPTLFTPQAEAAAAGLLLCFFQNLGPPRVLRFDRVYSPQRARTCSSVSSSSQLGQCINTALSCARSGDKLNLAATSEFYSFIEEAQIE